MSEILLLITLLTFISLAVLFYLLLTVYAPAREQVSIRLKSLETTAGAEKTTGLEEELARPFWERTLKPVVKDFAERVNKITPRSVRKMVDEKLLMSGGLGHLDTNEFLALWGGSALLSAGLAAGGPMVFKALAGKTVMLAMAGLAAGTLLPIIILNSKVAKRKATIQKQLPEVLDLITVSVEAGLSFDGALAKLAEKMAGPLVEEFTRAMQEMRVGGTRRSALHNMSRRCGVEDLSLLVISLIQADQLGVGIANVLRVQAVSIRERRRQRVQQLAMKAPVKMLIPLVLFIFPTIFIIILGPAVINIMASLVKR